VLWKQTKSTAGTACATHIVELDLLDFNAVAQVDACILQLLQAQIGRDSVLNQVASCEHLTSIAHTWPLTHPGTRSHFLISSGTTSLHKRTRHMALTGLLID
jgi:hypothetical protein